MGKSRKKMALISQRRPTFVDPAAIATELDEKLTIRGVVYTDTIPTSTSHQLQLEHLLNLNITTTKRR